MNFEQPAPPSAQAYFIRLPRSGEQCPYFGLNRSTFESLLKRAGGEIRTASLAASGKKRGPRVVLLQDVYNYLLKRTTGQPQQPSQAQPSAKPIS